MLSLSLLVAPSGEFACLTVLEASCMSLSNWIHLSPYISSNSELGSRYDGFAIYHWSREPALRRPAIATTVFGRTTDSSRPMDIGELKGRVVDLRQLNRIAARQLTTLYLSRPQTWLIHCSILMDIFILPSQHSTHFLWHFLSLNGGLRLKALLSEIFYRIP